MKEGMGQVMLIFVLAFLGVFWPIQQERKYSQMDEIRYIDGKAKEFVRKSCQSGAISRDTFLSFHEAVAGTSQVKTYKIYYYNAQENFKVEILSDQTEKLEDGYGMSRGDCLEVYCLGAKEQVLAAYGGMVT